MKKKCSKKTIGFLVFFLLFFGTAGYLTYYSGVVYLKNLPRVSVQTPQTDGQYENGRLTYFVPEEAIHLDVTTGKYFVLAARHLKDVLGERYLATKIDVWVLEEKDGMMRVDGIMWEEPVIVGSQDEIHAGDAVQY